MRYMTAAAPMQGTYIPQYTPVPPTAVPLEHVASDIPDTRQHKAMVQLQRNNEAGCRCRYLSTDSSTFITGSQWSTATDGSGNIQ
ncbi:hypothetical protein lerEdw1_020227 [Lerista edwardsae]|nr:hypothetical protein lerEdw1_020227 [Lerista edwardsae]